MMGVLIPSAPVCALGQLPLVSKGSLSPLYRVLPLISKGSLWGTDCHTSVRAGSQ